jgi:hypothetical protein
VPDVALAGNDRVHIRVQVLAPVPVPARFVPETVNELERVSVMPSALRVPPPLVYVFVTPLLVQLCAGLVSTV